MSNLEPIHLITDEPVYELDSDHLELKPWAKMIAGAAVGTKGPFTIGVHGQWGYGKTTLLRLAKRLVEQHDEKAVTVWFNAWQFEREEHPLFPLIAAIADEIEQKTKTTTGRAMEGLRSIGGSLRALTRGMKFKGEVGIPLVGKFGAEFDSAKALEAEELIGRQTDPLQAEMLYHSAFRMLEDVARNKAGIKIVVFIDDLDRCQPEKAVFLLESIKLILAQPGFVFTLAVDRRVIESYLDKRFTDYCGEREGRRGQFYLDKIIQLPIPIPSHRTRFDAYVKRVIDDLAKSYTKESEAIKALRAVQDVVTAGADTNPRTLIRFINNFLLDCSLWPLIPHDGSEYDKLDNRVAAALALNRILQRLLGDHYETLIRDQTLCSAILADELDHYADDQLVEPSVFEESARPQRKHDARLIQVAIIRELQSHLALLTAIKEHGKEWLRSSQLRVDVYEFAQTQRSEADVVDMPESIAAAVRKQLILSADEPVPPTRLGEVMMLNLSSANVTDADLAHLKGLSSLNRLSLAGTKITDAGLANLKGLSNLVVLDLNSTKVTGAGLSYLDGLSNLSSLLLRGTELNDAGLANLNGLPRLSRLVLSNTKVTDVGLAHLKGLPNLSELYLAGTQVSDAGVEHLSQLSNLSTLSLEKTNVTDAGLVHLKALRGLTRLLLDLADVTDAGLVHLKTLPKLSSLYIVDTKVTGAGLGHLRQLPKLAMLSLGGSLVTDACLAHLKALHNLTQLYLIGTEVSDAGVKYLLELSNLTELSLEDTKVTDSGLLHLKALPKLAVLYLAGTLLTETGLASVREALPGVRIRA